MSPFKIVVGALLLVPLAFVARSSNILGYCSAQDVARIEVGTGAFRPANDVTTVNGRLLLSGGQITSQGYIEAAAREIVRRHQLKLRTHDIIYKSADEFLRMNVNCCDVAFSTANYDGDWIAERLSRFLGIFKVTVGLHYRQSQCGSNQYTNTAIFVTACGDVMGGASNIGTKSARYEFKPLSDANLIEDCK